MVIFKIRVILFFIIFSILILKLLIYIEYIVKVLDIIILFFDINVIIIYLN